AQARVTAMREANRVHAACAKGFEHRVDAVDHHHSVLGARDSGLGDRDSRAATKAAARSRHPRIFGTPASWGSSAPRSIAGTARSNSGPSARPVKATRIGGKSAFAFCPVRTLISFATPL